VRFPCEKQLRIKSADIFKRSVTNLSLRVLAEPESNAMKMQVVRQASRVLRQFTPCILAAGIGIAVSVTAASMTAIRENRNAEQQFNVMAENNFMVVQNGVNEYVNKLRALRGLFDSSEVPVSRNSFEAFTRPLLIENAAIATLSWVPRVLNSERVEIEREAVQQGLPDYQIKMMDADGVTMSPSPERSEYYPVFYATAAKTSRLYGLDLRSEPPTLLEMEQARDKNRLGISGLRTLITVDGKEGGFLFSLPVYKRGPVPISIEDRRRNLAGFVHGSLVIGKMFETIITTNKTPEGLDSYFFLPDAGSAALPIYVYGSGLRSTALQPASRGSLAAGSHLSRNITADGQLWLTMDMVPMRGGPLIGDHDRAWIVLIFGLVITGIVVTYIGSSRRHALHMLRVNQKVSDLARLDALTGLANRRAFMDRLGAAFAAARRGAKPFAVLYFDLDHFKDVNDTLGHAAGDELLHEVAARVLGAVRGNDIVARFGGDEFAILQSDADHLAAAGTLASKIGKIVAEPYSIGGNEVHISASIGISRYTPDVAGPDAVMIQADLALYRAKTDGRNCVRFHSAELDREVTERVIITDELRGAAERDELELYYQPQVDIRSGRIAGMEALLRWNHPTRGQILPSVFIPIAERSGEIQPLGQWALDAACRQLQLWQSEGIAPETVGVNFSALQFKGSADVDRDVAASLDKWGIAPGKIEIELTESVLMDITQQQSDRFERLRRRGVRIAIDDFGTGYSSLNYLANYPINRIKIAQELVFGVDTDSRSATVVRAAIRLAHELGIEIIAEGVETEGQEKFLLSAGCEHAQGYFFSRPVTAARATELLRTGTIKPIHGALRLVQTTAA
jgi:diguanylate cyclase (GGDEF)-like protein